DFTGCRVAVFGLDHKGAVLGNRVGGKQLPVLGEEGIHVPLKGFRKAPFQQIVGGQIKDGQQEVHCQKQAQPSRPNPDDSSTDMQKGSPPSAVKSIVTIVCFVPRGEKGWKACSGICAVFAEFSGTDPGVPSGLNLLPEPPARAFGIRKIATVGDLRIGGIGSGRFLRRKAGATREGCDGARDIVCRLRCDHRGYPFFLSIRQGSGASRICAVPGTVSGSSRCPGVGSIPNWRRAKRYSSRNSAFPHTFDHRILAACSLRPASRQAATIWIQPPGGGANRSSPLTQPSTMSRQDR